MTLLIINNSSADTEEIQIGLSDLNAYASETNAHHLETFVLKINQRMDADFSFDYYTRYGTAIPGQDYIPVSGTAIIPTGETQFSINVQVFGDISLESNETFEMVLINPSVDIFPEGITEIAVTHTIVNDDIPKNIDNTQAIARNLSQTFIAGISPVTSIQTLLDQTDSLSNLFALNLTNLTLSCPNGGSFEYIFTDSNADSKYSSVGDNLEITVNQCKNADTTINGVYALTISDVVATTTHTEVILNNLSIVNTSSSSLFTGILQVAETESSGTEDTLLVLNSSSLQLSNDAINYVFSSVNTQVAKELISSETKIQNYNTTVNLINSSNDGTYMTAMLEELKKRPTDLYPYTGKFTIQRQDGAMNITITVLSTTHILIETDTNNDGIRDYSQVVAWNQLSSGF
jgi:hypothetical protein